jgi:Uma2 family endonuclease
MDRKEAVMTTPIITIEPEQSATPATRQHIPTSYEAYLEWEHEGGLAEWVEGKVIIHDMPKQEHQRCVAFLDRLLGLFVRLFHLGTVYIAPYPMRMHPGGNAREPDVLFVAAQHQHRLTRTELVGPADLVIEVVSDESVHRDRSHKFGEYAQGGVREYWILDPRPGHEQADFYVLDAHGHYQPAPVSDNGVYHSQVLPGFWLRVTWLWQDDPDAVAALAEVVGTEQLMQAIQTK